MNVTASTRRKALLGIYRIRRKRKGGRLASKELERAWTPTTGLRRADLTLALRDAVEHHVLEVKESAQAKSYELTYLGERAMYAIPDVRDWITLLRARMRRSRRGVAGLRRASDTAAPAL